MNKTIAIIPARGGSKRIPEKNIQALGDLSLIEHSITYAKENREIIDEVYVSTDNDAIKQIALDFGVKVIDRPESISGDLEPTVSALKHVLESINHEQIENVVLLQPTNPLRPENLLREAFEKFQSNNKDSLFTVSRSHHKLGKIIDNKFVPFNYSFGQRSQDLEPLYFENGLLYISKKALIFSDIIISKDALPYKVNHIFAQVDIDTLDDLEYARYLYQKK